MGLRIKKFKEIYGDMQNWVYSKTNRLTDFSVGSAIRSLLEAVASAIEQAYFSMYRNVMWAIENSIYEAFSFTKLPARESHGTLTLRFTSALNNELLIPTGTKFIAFVSNKVLYFETKTDYSVVVGSVEADIVVHCTEKGIIGNVPAGTIRVMANPIQLVSEVTNVRQFTTGVEEETKSSRKNRFGRFVATRSRGTVEAIEYGTKEVEGVTGVYVDDSFVGIVYVYAHDANGDLSEELETEIASNLYYYRAGGIPCEVLPVEKVFTDVILEIRILGVSASDSLKTDLENAIFNFINNFPVSKSLYISELVQFVMNYDDVAVVRCAVNSPTEDVLVEKQRIIRTNSVEVLLKS